MTPQKPFLNLPLRSAFLVWGPPSHGPRSKVLARELGIEALHFIYLSTKRGLLSVPIRYSYQALKTLQILFQEHPDIVFVQSPPSFAVMFVYLYCALTGAKYLVDAHSAALQLKVWIRPEWLHHFLAQRPITTIVTNEHFQQMIQIWGGHAFVLRDIPTSFDNSGEYPVSGHFNIVVVNTFSEDEPLGEVLEAAKNLPEVNFYVTGRKKMAAPEVLAHAPINVHFTDFLPDMSYYGLLNAAQAVICLTTRNHTMQRGACEALSLGKPIITSDWPLLQTYFHKGTIHIPNTSEAIRQGVLKMEENYQQYQAEIKELQMTQQQEWKEKVELLMNLIEKSVKLSYRMSNYVE
jgi:glycosyltransferase involved in cell wall biosynthesis